MNKIGGLILSNFKTYFKYLNAQNMGKKRIKELMIFHMPILGYIRYVM